MVREQQQQQQQPIMRDFLGLGNLVTDDHGHEEGSRREPKFHTIQDLQTPGINMDFTGAKHPMCNIGRSTEHNFALRKASEERYLEGSAENYGLPCSGQLQGLVSGANTTLGGPPARVLASDTYATPNVTQLTIFYGGQVNVFNNMSADKAQAIMQMAAMGASWPSNVPTPPSRGVVHALGTQGFYQPAGVAENLCFNAQISPIHLAADQASQNGTPANNQFECGTPTSAPSSQPAVPKALPLARKASLARFLEKRKERMQMMSPYFKKQLTPGQVLSGGDQFLGSFQGASLSKLYEEYYRRPMTMVYGMQEPIVAHNDISSRGIPAKES